ncbi:response regulator [Nitrospira defluvii]|uniref:Response regulatory domain-containing protein n=1 Tax=Nitrospira defluvii TaxID=330214 RepID=A0ABN7LYL1_9BACT|nr:response regulator [Nitrospira defluvii]CAE6767698.1 Response regulatory domain-containing protein [Nitrospira defluvii]
MPKILIADDSIAVRKVAERLLTEAGMGVTLAANGSEALALLAKDRPDLIVSDVIMPDKSGYEVCAYIRGQANLADLPVLLISGIVNDEVSRQAETCKADGVLKKPFQGSSLKDRVLDLLTKRPHKPVPLSEAPQLDVILEPPASEPVTAAQVLSVQQETVPILQDRAEEHQSSEFVTMNVPEPVVLPLSHHLSVDETPIHQSAEPVVSTQADERYHALLAQRDARIAELEGQLVAERQANLEQMRQIQQALHEQREQGEAMTLRVQVLEQRLADERAQQATLTQQLEDMSRQAHRVGELESALAEERHRVEHLSQQVSDATHHAARIAELEAHLEAEREAANQLVQQITSLEHVEDRVRELERTLSAEREECEAHRGARAQLENVAAMVPILEEAGEKARAQVLELEGALSAERESGAILLAQVKQLEEGAARVQELEQALAGEQERSQQLVQRTAEAEQLADQSTRRFEDLARKLGEIAGLASQLGAGKR